MVYSTLFHSSDGRWIFFYNLKVDIQFWPRRFWTHPLSWCLQVAAQVHIIKADQAALNRVRLGEFCCLTPWHQSQTSLPRLIINEPRTTVMYPQHMVVSESRKKSVWPNRIQYLNYFALICISVGCIASGVYTVEYLKCFIVIKNSC